MTGPKDHPHLEQKNRETVDPTGGGTESPARLTTVYVDLLVFGNNRRRWKTLYRPNALRLNRCQERSTTTEERPVVRKAPQDGLYDVTNKG